MRLSLPTTPQLTKVKKRKSNIQLKKKNKSCSIITWTEIGKEGNKTSSRYGYADLVLSALSVANDIYSQEPQIYREAINDKKKKIYIIDCCTE